MRNIPEIKSVNGYFSESGKIELEEEKNILLE